MELIAEVKRAQAQGQDPFVLLAQLRGRLANHPAPLIQSPAQRTVPKVGRNEPCPCNSGKKHKRCCGG